MEVGRREAERITGYEAGGYAESATERNAEVRKVSTNAGALDKDFDCGRLSVAAAAAVLDVLIDPTIALAPALIRRVVILNSVTFIWCTRVVRAGPLSLLE
jgi:hypothetical protein